eukprot:950594-Pyramimonas_sp.AAC.1
MMWTLLRAAREDDRRTTEFIAPHPFNDGNPERAPANAREDPWTVRLHRLTGNFPRRSFHVVLLRTERAALMSLVRRTTLCGCACDVTCHSVTVSQCHSVA